MNNVARTSKVQKDQTQNTEESGGSSPFVAFVRKTVADFYLHVLPVY